MLSVDCKFSSTALYDIYIQCVEAFCELDSNKVMCMATTLVDMKMKW